MAAPDEEKTEEEKEALELAESIAGGKLDEAPPSSEESSEKKKEDDNAEPPKASQEPKPGEKEEPKDGEKKEGDDEDPLAGLDVKALLKHPELGPKIQRWSDGAGANQVETALERERQSIRESAVNDYQEQQWASRFQNLDEQQLRELLATNSEAAAAYGRYQQRQQDEAQGKPKDILRAGQTFAYAAQIATFSQVLEEAGLDAETKAKLDPKNFTDQGPDGIVVWGEAINTAIIEHKVAEGVQAGLEEKWEAFKEEKLAEEEAEGGPPTTPTTRKPGALPDLMSTPASVQLEQGLKEREEARSK
jgi:hypothetical protein